MGDWYLKILEKLSFKMDEILTCVINDIETDKSTIKFTRWK
jgi:hypothetical protein